MTPALEIFVVEDNRIAAEELVLTLEDLGHHVIGKAHAAAQALELLKSRPPQVALLDIDLGKGPDGVSIAQVLREELPQVAIIFITAFSDEGTLERVRPTFPDGYLVKPWEEDDLRVVLDIVGFRVLSQHGQARTDTNAAPGSGETDDHLFVRKHDGYERIYKHSIRWIQARGAYADIHTTDGRFTVSVPLRVMLERLGDDAQFVRVHRSYAVNISAIERFESETLLIDGEEIPVSKANRAALREQLGL